MLHQDVHWPRAAHWLAGEYSDRARYGELVVCGVPVNQSISPGRCDLAPAAIRQALLRYSTANLDQGHDLLDLLVRDEGDLGSSSMSPEMILGPLSDRMGEALDSAAAIAMLGGDNGLTRAGVHGLAQAREKPLSALGLITLDAHFDLRETTHGLHNGNPIRALLDDGMPGENIVQIGIQSFANSSEYARVGREAGITCVTMDQVRQHGVTASVEQALKSLEAKVDSIYVDCDLDVMDRAFVPGTPGSRPGGFTPWEARQACFLAGAHPRVRAIDFVEFDPTLDQHDLTSFAAGACFLSFASGLLARLSR